MTPMLILFHGLDTYRSYETVEQLLSYVPEAERENFHLGGNSLNEVIVRDLVCFGCALLMLFCHYNIEIQTKILIIERHKISKQQKQLQQFFQNQKQAIILYNFKNAKPDPLSSSSTPEVNFGDLQIDVPL